MNTCPTADSNQFGLAVAALVIAIGGILFPIPSYVELYQIPVGAACRPMGQAAALFLCGLGTPLVVVIFGLFSLAKGRISRVLGITAILLSMVPLPLYFLLFRWVVRSHHLILES